jgi:DNA polymerase elongation subunit (family B)
MAKRILALDIETAPDIGMLWSLKVSGYIDPKNIVEDGYVLSFAAQWIGQGPMMFSKTTDGHLKMLRQIHALLVEADAAVHFNGKRFDIPTLNKEFLLNGMAPIGSLVQIDLYPLVKRLFKFPSSSLDFVCRRLGIGCKLEHAGREMWWACMNSDHPLHDQMWKKMERYNRHDVTLLVKLYSKLQPWFEQCHGYKRIAEWLDGRRTKP